MSIYDIEVKKRGGEAIPLKEFEGKVLLVVNTATGCGFTPQYKALEELYETYHDRGFEVLDFPCNQFGHQAPGEDEEIREFCTAKYQTRFDQFAKIEVNGENEHPLYSFLKAAQPDEEIRGMKNRIAMKTIKKISKTCKEPGDIKWNFTKFLVDRAGNVVERRDPTADPAEMAGSIEKLL